MLWQHAGQFTPQGDIGSLPDVAIAEAVGWKKPAQLIDALVQERWLERNEQHRLIVHDWPSHCDNSVLKWLDYNEKDFVPVYGVSLADRKKISGKGNASRVAKAKAIIESTDSENSENSEDAKSFEVPPLGQKWTQEECGCFLESITWKRFKVAWRVTESQVQAVLSLPADDLPKGSELRVLHWFLTKFEIFWCGFWRKVSKKQAREAFFGKAWAPAWESGDLALISKIQSSMEGQHAEMMERDPNHRPHAATWLNNNRFDDEVALPARSAMMPNYADPKRYELGE